MDNKMIGVPDFAKKYGYAPETVRRWCRNGDIPDVEQDGEGKPWRIPGDAVPPTAKYRIKASESATHQSVDRITSNERKG